MLSRGGVSSVHAAFFMLRALAAKNSKSQVGLFAAVGADAASERYLLKARMRTARSCHSLAGQDAAAAARIADGVDGSCFNRRRDAP